MLSRILESHMRFFRKLGDEMGLHIDVPISQGQEISEFSCEFLVPCGTTCYHLVLESLRGCPGSPKAT